MSKSCKLLTRSLHTRTAGSCLNSDYINKFNIEKCETQKFSVSDVPAEIFCLSALWVQVHAGTCECNPLQLAVGPVNHYTVYTLNEAGLMVFIIQRTNLFQQQQDFKLSN